MNHTDRIAQCCLTALDTGAPAKLVVSVIGTSHRKRLRRLYRLFAVRFLEAFHEMRLRPGSRHAKARCVRAKATVDLLRAKVASLGAGRPDDATLLDWAREADLPRIVHTRQAA